MSMGEGWLRTDLFSLLKTTCVKCVKQSSVEINSPNTPGGSKNEVTLLLYNTCFVKCLDKYFEKNDNCK